MPTRVLILLPGYSLLNGYPDARVPIDSPKHHTKYVKLSFLLTTPSWIALVNHSKPSIKWFEWFHETGFRFNKLIALNQKILNRFRFGLANRLRPLLV